MGSQREILALPAAANWASRKFLGQKGQRCYLRLGRPRAFLMGVWDISGMGKMAHFHLPEALNIFAILGNLMGIAPCKTVIQVGPGPKP